MFDKGPWSRNSACDFTLPNLVTNHLNDTNSIDELLRANASATAVCRTCGTQASIDLQQLRGSFGGSVALRRIAFRIMCTGCGAADCGTTILPQPPD